MKPTRVNYTVEPLLFNNLQSLALAACFIGSSKCLLHSQQHRNPPPPLICVRRPAAACCPIDWVGAENAICSKQQSRDWFSLRWAEQIHRSRGPGRGKYKTMTLKTTGQRLRRRSAAARRAPRDEEESRRTFERNSKFL